MQRFYAECILTHELSHFGLFVCQFAGQYFMKNLAAYNEEGKSAKSDVFVCTIEIFNPVAHSFK